MPYTTAVPTLSDGVTVDAADLNEYADALNALGAAWTGWTPALTASTTNPTLGTSSTASGRYLRVNKFVVCDFQIIFGTSPTAGSGTYYISLPVTAATSKPYKWIGSCNIKDSSTGNIGGPLALGLPNDGTKVRIVYPSAWPTGTSTEVTHAVPWTWAAGDELNGWALFEAA
jgi:hypothetical protein